MRYNFGLYHWRRRFRSLATSVVVITLALSLYRRAVSRLLRLLAAGTFLWGLWKGVRIVRTLGSPAPWKIEAEKYEALTDELPFAEGDRILDIGCGTGRSLVGIAPAVPPTCTTIGLDLFDDRIILGNAPGLARRNARNAGLDVLVVRGDATRLPVSDDSVDVVTACRILHDLSATAAKRTLSEAHRVCRPDGRLGVLELPITHVRSSNPTEYWCELVSDAGFDIAAVEELDLNDRRYVVVVGEPG